MMPGAERSLKHARLFKSLFLLTENLSGSDPLMDVFISYACEDRDIARKLANLFEVRGWTVWWDRKITAGQPFDQIIEKELNLAKSVVVLWSKNSITSEWVRNEAAVAMERNVIIPVLIEHVKLPLEFRRRQVADLVAWDYSPSHEKFMVLCHSISTLVTTTTVSPPPLSKNGYSPWVNRKLGLIIGTIMTSVILALAYWILIKQDNFLQFVSNEEIMTETTTGKIPSMPINQENIFDFSAPPPTSLEFKEALKEKCFRLNETTTINNHQKDIRPRVWLAQLAINWAESIYTTYRYDPKSQINHSRFESLPCGLKPKDVPLIVIKRQIFDQPSLERFEFNYPLFRVSIINDSNSQVILTNASLTVHNVAYTRSVGESHTLESLHTYVLRISSAIGSYSSDLVPPLKIAGKDSASFSLRILPIQLEGNPSGKYLLSSIEILANNNKIQSPKFILYFID